MDESHVVVRPNTPFLDERVARAKFVEAEQLYEQRALFEPRGWLIEPPEFSKLIVHFQARDGRAQAGVRLELRNYDFLPPSVVFLDASGQPHSDLSLGVRLRPYEESHVPPALNNGQMLVSRNGGYLPGGHPLTRQPFLCVRGVWEYHTHPQHAEILWESIRGSAGYGLQYVIEQAHNAFRKDLFR